MASTYEFVPGRGAHYGGRIRSFVLRNNKARQKRKNSIMDVDTKHGPTSLPKAPLLADSQNLLVGQIDPFNTFDTSLDQFENNMLHHYIQSCIPNLGKRSSKESFFPPRDIDWQSIRGNTMLMSAAIQFAAMSVALIESKGDYRIENANKYQVKTLQIVRRQLEIERLRPTDAMLHTIIGLIATDTHIRRCYQATRTEESEVQLSCHIEGLRAALDCRHGWNLPYYSPVLQWEFLWQDVVLNGRLSAGKTIFSPHLKKVDVTETLRSGSSFRQQWDRLCVLEFIAAYTDIYEAARLHNQEESTNRAELLSPEIQTLFSPGTRAYETMSSNEAAVVRPIVPILLVNIIVFHLQRASAEEIAYQYWALRKKFRRCDVHLGSGPAYLCYAAGMTTDMKSWAEPQQMCLLARMLGVESKFSEASRMKLKHSLLEFISGSATDHEHQEGWWRPEDLREQMRVEGIIDC